MDTMTPTRAGNVRSDGGASAQPSLSFVDIATVLLRHRRLLVALPASLLVLTVGLSLLRPRSYTASASFIGRGSERSASSVAGLAAQFGLAVSSATPGQSPEFYADLIRSRAVLDTVAMMPYAVGRSTEALWRVLGTGGQTAAEQRDNVVEALGKITSVETDRLTGIVSLGVTTTSPALSQQIAANILTGVNAFNLKRRQTQAAAERRFVEERLRVAQGELRAREDRLEQFLQGNRSYQGSPTLQLSYDRLHREVEMLQTVVTSLTQSFEQARIEEVRNLPVITVIDQPAVPTRPNGRGTVRRGLLALVLGTLAAVFLAFGLDYTRRTRVSNPERFEELDRMRRELLSGLRPPRGRRAVRN